MTDPTTLTSSAVNVNDGHAHIYSDFISCVPNYAYRKPTKNKNGGNVVYVNANAKVYSAMTMQLCRDPEDEDVREEDREVALKAPFGLQDPKAGSNDMTRKTLDLSIDNDRLLQFIKAWDGRNIEAAVENSELWFGKKMTMEFLQFLYKPMAKPPKPSKDPNKDTKHFKPTIRVKVSTGGDEKTRTRVWMQTGRDPVTKAPIVRKAGFDELTKKVHVVPIVTCTGMWFMDASFGCGLQATDLMIIPRKPKLAMDFVGARPILASESNQQQQQQVSPKNNNSNNSQSELDALMSDAVPAPGLESVGINRTI